MARRAPSGPARWPLAATPAGPADVGPRPAIAYAVTALDRYRSCPFKYFARDVLGLEEDVVEETGLSARARGTLVHAVFQTFFDEWTAAGHGAIDAAALPAARTLFAAVVDRLLQTIPPSERPIERAVLLGSAVAAGLGERAFRFEAAQPQPLVARELEVKLDGEYTLGPGARPIRLRGTADRIDLLGDGTLRLIDYKTGKASNARELLQVKIYGACAETRLHGHLGRTWTVGRRRLPGVRPRRRSVRRGAHARDPRRGPGGGRRRGARGRRRGRGRHVPGRPRRSVHLQLLRLRGGVPQGLRR